MKTEYLKASAAQIADLRRGFFFRKDAVEQAFFEKARDRRDGLKRDAGLDAAHARLPEAIPYAFRVLAQIRAEAEAVDADLHALSSLSNAALAAK